jgi:hypothetical protein
LSLAISVKIENNDGFFQRNIQIPFENIYNIF